MRTETKYVSNIYWSFRKYLKAQLSTEKRFYNPTAMPDPTGFDRWLIYYSGLYDANLFARINPSIVCVARNDKDGSDLIDLVSDVFNIFDNPADNKRSITFYDKTTGDDIGDINIDVVRIINPVSSYKTGISSSTVDIFGTVKTDRILK